MSHFSWREPDPEEKACTSCEESKPLSEFHGQKTGKYGKHAKCKLCMKKIAKIHGEKIRERNRIRNSKSIHRESDLKYCYKCKDVKANSEFNNCITNFDGKQSVCRDCEKFRRHENKQKFIEYTLLRKYGITIADRDAMIANQGGKCNICQCDNKDLVIDHCHTTGKVRGLLCQSCNVFLGGAETLERHKLQVNSHLKRNLFTTISYSHIS